MLPDGAEPTNADLFRMLEDLKQEWRQDRLEEEARFSRLEGKMESVLTLVATLQRQVDVQRATADAEHKMLSERMDRHDGQHEKRDKDQREQEKFRLTEQGNSALRGQLVVAMVTASVAVLSFVIGFVAR